MITNADKKADNKSQAHASSLPKPQNNGKAAFQFVNNWPAAIAQRKLQEAISHSPQVQQLKAYQEMANNSPQVAQQRSLQEMADNKPPENNTGLPNKLKAGIEHLSGLSMDNVKVHYNSSQPAQLQAHAYAQGTDIHLAPGQEKHLPHEAWHVVQQKQGRVKPTLQLKGNDINDNSSLEMEADVMGNNALQMKENPNQLNPGNTHSLISNHGRSVIQAKVNIHVAADCDFIEENAKGGPAPKATIQRYIKIHTGPKELQSDYASLTQFLKHFGHNLNEEDAAALTSMLADPAKRRYETTQAGADELYAAIYTLVNMQAQPIATVSFNFRYHKFGGKGALKYDPVTVAKKPEMDRNAVNFLHGTRKIEQEPEFDFKIAIEPGCKQYGRKIMMVPSVGCPPFLASYDHVARLQWAVFAAERPTFLFVPLSELPTYQATLGPLLTHFGVGLAGWHNDGGALGFGTSRLAAQEFAIILLEAPKQNIVMCDVNVAASKPIRDGYETGSDAEEDRSVKHVKGPLKYSAAGKGTGIPTMVHEEESKNLRKKKGVSAGGDGRPIEQVVIVGVDMPYDAAFITSSEDADLTNRLLAQERATKTAAFKGKARIDKVEMGHHTHQAGQASASAHRSGPSYMEQRAQLLSRLAHEDRVRIKYRKGGKEELTTIGALATAIAQQHGLNKDEIRSLILEKIILEAKRRWYKEMTSAASHPPSDGESSESDDDASESSSGEDSLEEANGAAAASGSSAQKHKAKRRRREDDMDTSGLDFAVVNGQRYAINDPRIASMGQCLWDTLRQHEIPEPILVAAANEVQLVVDQHTFEDMVWPLITAINRLSGQNHGLIIDRFDIFTGAPLGQIKVGNQENVIRIGFAIDQTSGAGHFVPPY